MQTVKLGEIVDVKKGKKPEVVLGAPCDGSRPCILIDEVRGNVPTNFTTDAKGVEVSKNDICIIWDGANAGTIGFGVEGLIGSTVARLRIISQNRWDTKFVGRLLQGQFQSINAAAHGKGATIPHVDKRHLEEIEFPVYSLEEQKRIAAILDQADDIRRKRQHAIDRLNQLGQAIFHEMFGDPATLPRSHSFAEVAAIQQSLVDPKLPQYRGELHVGPEHIVSGSGNVEWHRVRTAEQDNVISGKNRFNEHDILYSKIRPYLNKVALSDRSGICSADMYVIRPEPKKSVAQFLKMLLMGSDFLSYAETCSNRANIPKINRKQLEAYKFYCPSMELQQEFERRLTDLEVLKKPFFSANEGGQQLFESLQHRAFTGQL